MGNITVAVNRKQELLELTITDDGIGRHNVQSTHKRSFGIKITAERLALLNAANNPGMGVYITDLEYGTRVELKIPYKANTEK